MGELATSPSPTAVDLAGTVTSLGARNHQISESHARPRRVRPGDEATDLRRSHRGGRSRRDKKPKPQQPAKTILKRPSLPTDLAAPVMLGAWDWDYEAQLRRQREWYLMNTAAAPDPYFPQALEDPPLQLWSPRPSRRCHECEAAAAALREPAFHWCVRDAVTVGFRSHVGPIERPAAKKSPPPQARPAFLGMPVY